MFIAVSTVAKKASPVHSIKLRGQLEIYERSSFWIVIYLKVILDLQSN